VSLVYYRKENQDLYLISQCDLMRSFNAIQEEMERLAVGWSMLEFVDQVAHDQEENASLFALILNFLETLNLGPKNPQTLWRAFQIRLASLYGFSPSFEFCKICNRSLSEIEDTALLGFSVTDGAVLCAECQKQNRFLQKEGITTIAPSGLQILKRFLDATIDTLPRLVYSDRLGNELDEIIRLYIGYHFEHLKPIRSIRMFKTTVTPKSAN
jgi:DNA repair protein RecO